MTYQEYRAKRDVLMNQLQNLIDGAAPDQDYETKKAEINKLDNEWEAIANRQADYNAIYGNHNIVPPWVTAGESGEVCIMGRDNYYISGKPDSRKIFLNERRGMADFARERKPEQAQLMSGDGTLGEVVKGIVTGAWDNLELKNMVTTSGTSVIIPEVLSGQVIDLARDVSLFTQANVPVVPMETNNMTVSRIKKDPVFAFKAEGEAANESSFELDSVQLKAKTVYGYAYVTLEALQSSRNLDEIIKRTFAAAIAQAIDRGMLYGQKTGTGFDSYAPAGIMNDANILSMVSEGGYNDYIKAAAKIRKNNGVPSTVALNAATDESLQLLTDKNGVYLAPPPSFSALRKIVTNQLNYDAETGSDSLVFDPQAMMIGIQDNIRIKVLDGSDEAIKKGLVAFQIFAMLDCVVVNPKAICRISGIRA